MIYVSCGHENGIGLEVFIKSFMLLDPHFRSDFILIAHLDILEKILKSLRIKYKILNSSVSFASAELNFISLTNTDLPPSTISLLTALDLIKNNKDILITLPTSKDQLLLNNKSLAGHTEFFRTYFNNQNISMIFNSYNENLLLITDHVALSNVSKTISEDLILHKISTTLADFHQFFQPITSVYISGINPHSGENGILGSEDTLIVSAIDKLKTKFPNVYFEGPLPGDTLHLKRKSHDALFVYMYHDQALSKFKAENQFIGANISLGLPFLRISVDHGTAFDLYGKNSANFSGSLYTLQLACKVHSFIRNQ